MKLHGMVVAALVAIGLFGALAASASARQFSASARFLDITFSRLDFTGAFGTTECIITLEGSLHSQTVPKVVGSLVGYLYDARIAACFSGAATILRETLPWHVRYESFSGTLPDVTFIRGRLIDAAFRVSERGGFSCLARTTATEPATLRFRRNVGTQALTDVQVGGEIRTGAECFGARGTLTGLSSSLTDVGHHLVTVTLI